MPIEHLFKKEFISAATIGMLLLALHTSLLHAQENPQLPRRCYVERNGERIIDMTTCSIQPHRIPSTLLNQGYIDTLGFYSPYLPTEEMVNFYPGDYVFSTPTFMVDHLMEELYSGKIERWTYDASLFRGGVSVDFAQTVGGTLWIRPLSSQGPFDGPYLIVGTTRSYDLPRRMCHDQGIELSEEHYAQLLQDPQFSGQIEIVFKPVSDLIAPPIQLHSPPVSMTDAWTNAFNFPCE